MESIWSPHTSSTKRPSRPAVSLDARGRARCCRWRKSAVTAGNASAGRGIPMETTTDAVRFRVERARVAESSTVGYFRDEPGGLEPGGLMKLSVKSLTTGLTFHGEVHGKRQHYYVLSTAREYFVMSISSSKRDAGNFNLVGKAAVDRLYRRLRGRRGLTAMLVYSRSRNRRLVRSHLGALNMLYVLVATGRASIDQRHTSRELFFNVKA